MPKNHSTITCKKGAKILPTFSCIEYDFFNVFFNIKYLPMRKFIEY